MRISDWSSDVCSSALVFTPFARIAPPLQSCRFCLPPEGASMSTAALDASKTPHRATAAFGWLGATLLAERGRWPLWLPVLLGAGVAAYFARDRKSTRLNSSH